MEAFDLRCGVCSHVKEAPHLLACLHSVCCGCLSAFVTQDGKNKACPTCDMPTPAALVSPMPTPDFLLARRTSTKQQTFCESNHGQEEEAYWYVLRGEQKPRVLRLCA